MAPRKKAPAAAGPMDILTSITPDAPATGDKAAPFTRVYGTLKGGVDVTLGACTAIVGDNRTGKTAVLDTVRLALTGRHPVGATYADLLTLTHGERPPEAHIVGPSGNAAFVYPVGKRTADHVCGGALRDLTDAQRASILPLASVRDLLALGSDRAREAIFARFGATSAMPVPPGLNEDQTTLWDDLKGPGLTGDAAAQLAAMGAALRSHKLACGKQAKAAEEEAERWRASAPTMPATAEQVAALEAQERAALLYEQTRGLRGVLASMQDDLRAAEAVPVQPVAAVPDVADVLAKIDAEKLKVEAELDAVQRRMGAAKVIGALRTALANGTHATCAVCGGATKLTALHDAGLSVEDAVAAEAARLTARRAELVEATGKVLRLKAQASDEAYAATQANVARERRIAELTASIVKASSALANAPTDPGVTAEEARRLVADARTGRESAERVNAALLTGRKARREAEDCKVLEKAAADLLANLVGGVAAKAEAAVRKYLPGGFDVRLALADADGKPICRWEAKGQDATFHPLGAASGAEWGALTVALGCAWSEGSPVRVLLLDDADLAPLSAVNVRALLDLVRQRVEAGDLTQAIVAWCRPEEISVDGWTVVRR